MPKKSKKVCVDCGRELLKYEDFYRITRYRVFPNCKDCVKSRKRKRYISSLPDGRFCRKCGSFKHVSEFKSSHGNSFCLDCSVLLV